ncbi:MAG: hypothetical protein COV57_00545 [Candidatus Liptonbacteria bacterium CG11_big_fil_rev_8_21_14_0_20_35_14]|uniref:Glycosyl transferase family 1 domain-containing protein n=1 Tax=Candidatus Liptonbacteria bacterium CG11_big_fil_rev_8_21_14_0_20_35_14 TaxID=1974634 RepID=A0A2H0N8H2_9BACT|nr:MAG: hypothetical protein COV57_00545 [Candidatus Liptonbacteria bacterium CG11_big_fil_rev_8_21_14_0_20_35_14]
MALIKNTMNSSIKANIFLELKDGPWGGGNQFLKAIKKYTSNPNLIYTENPLEANVILGITHHNIKKIIKIKKQYPKKLFIYRIGDIYEYHRGPKWKIMDKIIIELANNADWVIFQSNWSKKEAQKRGYKNKNYSIISNTPDPQYFNNQNKPIIKYEEKIRLIATSWSTNPNKGFEFYKFLDENLNFEKFNMTFIGNSPVTFKNTKLIKPLPSNKLSQELKKHHIFISPTKNEACSNSILEALACGLPVIALNSGSNHESIKNGGEIFNNEKELIKKINEISQNYKTYQNNIKIPSIKNTSNRYKEIFYQAKLIKGQKIKFTKYWKINILLWYFNHL